MLKSRVDTSGKGTSTHFVVYEFIPQVLSQHPLFGLGLNNFSVYYEFVTGPRQLRAALVLRGAVRRDGHRRRAALPRASSATCSTGSRSARSIGRALAAAGDAVAARVRPLEWGLTAALVGTMAANFFYLTMSFYYFFVFAMLAIVAPAVFGRRLSAT